MAGAGGEWADVAEVVSCLRCEGRLSTGGGYWQLLDGSCCCRRLLRGGFKFGCSLEYTRDPFSKAQGAPGSIIPLAGSNKPITNQATTPSLLRTVGNLKASPVPDCIGPRRICSSLSASRALPCETAFPACKLRKKHHGPLG